MCHILCGTTVSIVSLCLNQIFHECWLCLYLFTVVCFCDALLGIFRGMACKPITHAGSLRQNTTKCIPEVKTVMEYQEGQQFSGIHSNRPYAGSCSVKKMWWHLLRFSYAGSYSGTLLLPLYKSSLSSATENFFTSPATQKCTVIYLQQSKCMLIWILLIFFRCHSVFWHKLVCINCTIHLTSRCHNLIGCCYGKQYTQSVVW